MTARTRALRASMSGTAPLLLACALFAGCASAKVRHWQPAPRTPEGWFAIAPSDPAAPLFERESEGLTSFEFKSADQRYSGTVLASGLPSLIPQVRDSFLEVSFPIGSGTAVHCLISPPVPPAHELRDLLETKRRKRPLLAMSTASVRMVAGAPLMFVEVFDEKRAELKFAMTATPLLTLFCEHDQSGYRKTFAAAVRALAESLRDSTAPVLETPVFAELGLVHSGGELTGFEFSLRYPMRPDGSHGEQAWSARATQLPHRRFWFYDERLDTELGFKGQLRRYLDRVFDGDKHSSAALDEQPDGSYGVLGDDAGKPLGGLVRPKDGFRQPTNDECLSLAAGRIPALEFEVFSLASPNAPVHLQVGRGKQPNQLRVQSGSALADLWTLDEVGAIVRDEELQGLQEIRERVWFSGER